jgi:hypothetical protein
LPVTPASLAASQHQLAQHCSGCPAGPTQPRRCNVCPQCCRLAPTGHIQVQPPARLAGGGSTNSGNCPFRRLAKKKTRQLGCGHIDWRPALQLFHSPQQSPHHTRLTLPHNEHPTLGGGMHSTFHVMRSPAGTRTACAPTLPFTLPALRSSKQDLPHRP